MLINIDNQDLIEMIVSTYGNAEGYDLSEIKVENIVNLYEDEEEIEFDNLFDEIKFNTSMYYFDEIPGKLNMSNFKNDYSYIYPWSDYVSDCNEYAYVHPDKDEWYSDIAEMITEGAIITDDGIIVRK